jgi:hypothetical protein
MEVGIADDQAKDFDFEKTEMKYDSTGMFHWTPGGFTYTVKYYKLNCRREKLFILGLND